MQQKTPSLVHGGMFDFKISSISGSYLLFVLTLFKMVFFRAAHEWVVKRPSLIKICYKYPTMMELDIVWEMIKKRR